MECKICKKEAETRYGVCFNCAEAESIIGTGVDMYDGGIMVDRGSKAKKPAETAMEKLKLLIEKGWHL